MVFIDPRSLLEEMTVKYHHLHQKANRKNSYHGKSGDFFKCISEKGKIIHLDPADYYGENVKRELNKKTE